ncbi:MAG TPA: hypothetical protein VH913_05860 [Hyphomicrobiaceae bacterium]|jgi:hypothetical protein
MPMSPGASRLLHYSGYLHPVLSIVAGAACLIAIPFWLSSGQPIDLGGVAVLGGIGVLGLGYGAFALWRHRQQDPTTPVQTVDDLPPAEGARQTRRAMWIIAVIAVLGTAFMAYQLVQVEFGTERSVTVWGPVAMMYEVFGFWPAVLFVPVLGIVILFSMARKLRAIKEGQTGRV